MNPRTFPDIAMHASRAKTFTAFVEFYAKYVIPKVYIKQQKDTRLNSGFKIQGSKLNILFFL